MGQTHPWVSPQNSTDLSQMALVQPVCDSQKWTWSTTSFGSNPEWRSSRVPLTKIKHEDYQFAVSAENRAPSQKEKGKALAKVACNPSFMFWMVAFVSLLPRHSFFQLYATASVTDCLLTWIPSLASYPKAYSFCILRAYRKPNLHSGHFISKREFC